LDVQTLVTNVGTTIGLTALTAGGVFKAIILLLVGMIVIRILMNMVDRILDKSQNMHNLKSYIHATAKVGLWFLLILMMAGSLGIDVTSIIALLSVAGLAVSLALQNTLSNLAGGIMLLLAKPYQVGDYVEADGIAGTIAAIQLSYTTVIPVDNKEIFVPNSQLSATKITNYTVLGKRRVDLNFTASYDAPTKAVKAAIQEVVDAIPQIYADPAPVIFLTEYQSSSIQYQVRAWTSAADYWDVYFAIQEGVRESFAKHGVEMTYDHLNVHVVEK